MSSVNPNSRRRSGTTRPTVLCSFRTHRGERPSEMRRLRERPALQGRQEAVAAATLLALRARRRRAPSRSRRRRRLSRNLAIGAARIEGEHRAEVAADRESEIRAAHREGRLLSPDEKQRLTPRKQDEVSLQRHDDLLQHARALRKSEVANAAQTILMERQWGFLRGEAEPGLTPAESQTLQALQAGSGPSVLPDDLYRQAAKMVARRERRDRGGFQLPRSTRPRTADCATPPLRSGRSRSSSAASQPSVTRTRSSGWSGNSVVRQSSTASSPRTTIAERVGEPRARLPALCGQAASCLAVAWRR